MYKAHTGLSRREHAGKAPKPTNYEETPQKRSVTIIRGLKPAEWKPEPYTRMLFDACFKNW